MTDLSLIEKTGSVVLTAELIFYTIYSMELPDRYFRHSVVFRTFPAGGLWAGFHSKHGVTNDQIDKVPGELALILVLRGKGEYRLPDGRNWKLKPGTVFCRLPGIRHTTILAPDSCWQECFIAVGAEAFTFLKEQGIWPITSPVFQSSISIDWLDRLRDLIHKMQGASGNYLAPCWAEAVGLVSELIIMKDKSPAADREAVLREACGRLGRGFDQPLDMHALARETNMSYSLFRKLFKANTGQSPGAYRIQRRIDRACHLLVSTGDAVKDIAYELGYPDPYSFSEQFKKVIGLSPRNFRVRRGYGG